MENETVKEEKTLAKGTEVRMIYYRDRKPNKHKVEFLAFVAQADRDKGITLKVLEKPEAMPSWFCPDENSDLLCLNKESALESVSEEKYNQLFDVIVDAINSGVYDQRLVDSKFHQLTGFYWHAAGIDYIFCDSMECAF